MTMFNAIARHELVPEDVNPVAIETSGEFDEYVMLSYDEGYTPIHPGRSTVILSPAEANKLIIELEAWLHR